MLSGNHLRWWIPLHHRALRFHLVELGPFKVSLDKEEVSKRFSVKEIRESQRGLQAIPVWWCREFFAHMFRSKGLSSRKPWNQNRYLKHFESAVCCPPCFPSWQWNRNIFEMQNHVRMLLKGFPRHRSVFLLQTATMTPVFQLFYPVLKFRIRLPIPRFPPGCFYAVISYYSAHIFVKSIITHFLIYRSGIN